MDSALDVFFAIGRLRLVLAIIGRPADNAVLKKERWNVAPLRKGVIGGLANDAVS